MRKATVLVWLTLVVCVSAPVAHGQALWGYYPINQDDFKDYSGNNHHGTPVDGAVTVADTERGWVASFNKEPAKPSRVNLGTNDPSAGGQLTVSVWVYWRGINGNWQGIAGKSFSASDRRWVLQLRDSDGMIQWGGADNANLHIFSKVPLGMDEWLHVVGTCDGTTSRIFINGKNVGEGPGHFNPGADKANVTLGFAEDRSDYDESFNGMLDEIHIFSRGLSLDQVQALAQGVVPVFNKAREPNPANGATDVGAPLLRWTAGDGAVLHNVYLGTTPELGEAQLVSQRSTLPLYYSQTLFEPGKTYYWRVDEIEGDGVTVHPGDTWTFTTQALTAYGPNPADGAIDASPTPTLTWLAGQGAAKHHVYLSSSQDAVTKGDKTADKGIVDQPTLTPGDLQEAKTYYWRVDEVISATEVRTGPVWSFRTYVRVDDFESYTNDEGNRIYETWIDGAKNGTGSQVGYWEVNDTNPAFVELKIVHGGLQSMPFYYDNSKTPYYSEAEQEFPAAEGGGNYDIDTLVLWVRGQATNSPALVYVALKDAHGQTGVVSNLDPNVVTLNKWTEWRIFMPQFMMTGVDLMAVKKIMIGVGDRENPAADGKGLIFIDDIHAIKTMTFDPSQIPMMP
jgi:hypothetical protein